MHGAGKAAAGAPGREMLQISNQQFSWDRPSCGPPCSATCSGRFLSLAAAGVWPARIIAAASSASTHSARSRSRGHDGQTHRHRASCSTPLSGSKGTVQNFVEATVPDAGDELQDSRDEKRHPLSPVRTAVEGACPWCEGGARGHGACEATDAGAPVDAAVCAVEGRGVAHHRRTCSWRSVAPEPHA